MLKLKKDPSMSDLQEYVIQMEADRGFTNQQVIEKCLMFVEDVGAHSLR